MWKPGKGKGQYGLNKEKGESMMGQDGRPQWPTHPHPLPARPYDTTNRPPRPCIVGAGEVVGVGLGPLWLPVRTNHHLFSPYLKGLDPCGCYTYPPDRMLHFI